MPKAFTALVLAAALAILAACTAAPRDPLGRAAARGDLAGIDRLFRLGVSAADRQSALVWAARYGQPEAIADLIGRGADPNAAWGVNGWPPLLHAIHKNRIESIPALLDGGAGVDTGGPNGETPLMMAAGYGYTGIVRLLLQRGADAHRTMATGDNALDFAVTGVTDIDRFTWGNCQVETVRLLRRNVPGLRSSRDVRGRCRE